MTTREVPFTIDADLALGEAAALWLGTGGADVVIRRGAVPDSLPEAQIRQPYWCAGGGRFLLEPPGGRLRFLIEYGERIRYDAVRSASDAEILGTLRASPWAVLAYQRGLLSLHASAVCCNGRVHAFSGASGAGKSTLAVALAERGHPFFADDVLILDPARPDGSAPEAGLRCFAYQDAKLHADALSLTGARPLGRSRQGKWYAAPRRRSRPAGARLASLHVLHAPRPGDARRLPCTSRRLTGFEAMAALHNAVFRPQMAVPIVGFPRLFEWLVALERAVRVFRFHRPVAAGLFHRGVDYMARALPGLTTAGFAAAEPARPPPPHIAETAA